MCNEHLMPYKDAMFPCALLSELQWKGMVSCRDDFTFSHVPVLKSVIEYST